MALFPFTASIKCNRITSFSPVNFSPAGSFCNVSLPRKLPRNVHVFRNSHFPFTYHASIHKNYYCPSQNGKSLIAFGAGNSESGGDYQAPDILLKLYFAIKNKNTHELSEILADECQCVCIFRSFFQAFQGKKQVLAVFCYLIKVFGDNIQVVVKQTMHDGMSAGVQWKFTISKIHVPLGKGFSLHISHTYQGKAVIRNIEMFMEPLLYLETLRLKMTASLNAPMEKIGTLMSQLEAVNRAKMILCSLLAVLFLIALLFFLRLASHKAE